MLPWTTCGNEWNTPLCREFDVNISYIDASGWSIEQTPSSRNRSQSVLEAIGLRSAIEVDNNTRYTSAAQEYFT